MAKKDNENGTVESLDERENLQAGEAAAEELTDTADVDGIGAQLQSIAMERDRLLAANEELQGLLLRRQAEFENFRRRVDKERADFADYAGMEAIRPLLPILDDFERAVNAAPGELGPESEYVKGVEMIYQRLVDALGKIGLEPIDSAGKPFDPNFHHAVERVPDADADEDTVLEEWQKGYNFKGKLLREAMVRVAVKPSADD